MHRDRTVALILGKVMTILLQFCLFIVFEWELTNKNHTGCLNVILLEPNRAIEVSDEKKAGKKCLFDRYLRVLPEPVFNKISWGHHCSGKLSVEI